MHGSRLQRGGRGRLPDHRLRARAAARRADQQPHAVQRAVSGAHRAHDHVLCRGRRQLARQCAAAHGGARAERGADVRRDVAAEHDRAARQTVGLRTGAAAVPRTASRAGHRALRVRPDAVRARARGRRGRAGRDDSLDAGKRACRRREPAGLVRRCARPARAGDGHGRRAAAGIRARISGQRDRAADRRDGVSGAGQSGRFARAGADARAADRQRLDVDDRRECRAVFPAALAVLDDALDHPARDRQHKMDTAGGAAADGDGHGAVHGVHSAGARTRLVSGLCRGRRDILAARRRKGRSK